jgi:hypothetical protein
MKAFPQISRTTASNHQRSFQGADRTVDQKMVHLMRHNETPRRIAALLPWRV